MKRSEVIKLRELIEKAVESLNDEEAVQAKMLYPKWETLIGKNVEAGFKMQYNGKLCKVRQAHTVQADWTPDAATSLYEYIDEQHEGTLVDPIPYNGDMELQEGIYYIENEMIYLCNRPTGAPVFNALADLVGIYVSEVAR